MEYIDHKLAIAFQSASANLITVIRKAIDDFYVAPPHGWEAWERWRTPEPWKDRVVPNLEKCHLGLQKELLALDAGDYMPITLAAASYAGLSKDLDYDRSWMSNENQEAVRKAVAELVSIAHRIHRIGYDLSKKDGR